MPQDDRASEYADFSKELVEARRAMRKRLLTVHDTDLKDLYYRALMLSEHEARRAAFLQTDAERNPAPAPLYADKA